MVYAAETTGLGRQQEATAMACRVWVTATVMGAVYAVEAAVGVEPLLV